MLSSPPATKAQATLQALLQASAAAIIVVDAAGIVEAWNEAATHLFGFDASEMIGQPLVRLVPPDREGEARELMAQVGRGERTKTLETVRLHRSGERVPVSLSVEALHEEEETLIGAVWMARDLKARRQEQGELARLQVDAGQSAFVWEAANRVALDILSSRSGVEALRHIAEAARVLARARYAALGVAKPGGEGLSHFFTAGLSSSDEAAIGPLPRGAGVLGVLLRRGEPLRLDSVAAHPASVGFPPHHPPMGPFLGVPIRRGEVVLGSLYLSREPGANAFTPQDQVAVEAIGAHAAIAIHNLQMVLRQNRLVSSLITAQEEERRAVAYDLHDGLTQLVMAAHAHFAASKRAQAQGNAERMEREWARGERFLHDAVGESRRLINGLRPLALEDLGLREALGSLVEEEKGRAEWSQASWTCSIGERRFGKDLETTIYRVAQEALTNARKHAATERVAVALEWNGGAQEELRLEVRDFGRGFKPEEVARSSERVGLHGMAQRVHLVDGQLSLRSAPEQGTRVIATFPVTVPGEGEPLSPMRP